VNPINHEILMHAAKLKADHGRSSCDPRAYDLAVALLDAVEKIGEMKRLARQSSDSLADGLVTAADEAEEQRKRADRLETEIAQLRRRVVARTPEELLEQLHGAVTTTRNEAGEIVAITRTDDEGRILIVIWERDPEPPAACSG